MFKVWMKSMLTPLTCEALRKNTFTFLVSPYSLRTFFNTLSNTCGWLLIVVPTKWQIYSFRSMVCRLLNLSYTVHVESIGCGKMVRPAPRSQTQLISPLPKTSNFNLLKKRWLRLTHIRSCRPICHHVSMWILVYRYRP